LSESELGAPLPFDARVLADFLRTDHAHLPHCSRARTPYYPRALEVAELTIAMTMRSSHLAPDHLRAAVAVLDDVLPAPKFTESTKVSAQTPAQELVPAGEVFQKSS
jgi:hypothetical protein